MTVACPLRGLRVGRLPYLNVHPFHAGFRGEEPAWLTAAPRRLGELAAAGELDAAILASRDALALADRFRPLGSLGIACRGPVQSVLLFSGRPPEALEGCRVALTGESRTSRALLRILLAERYGLSRPSYASQVSGADALLQIGDSALRLLTSAGRGSWPHVIDLGQVWHEWTGLPFVYARWMVRRDVAAGRAWALERALSDSLARERAASLRGARLPPGIGIRHAASYLARFVYRFGPEEEAGLREFYRALQRNGLLKPPAPSQALETAA